MAGAGVAPSEHFTAASRRRGGILETGSGPRRHLLMRSAWSCRTQARLCRKLHDRSEGITRAGTRCRIGQGSRRCAGATSAERCRQGEGGREILGFLHAVASAVTARPTATVTPRMQTGRHALVTPPGKLGEAGRFSCPVMSQDSRCLLFRTQQSPHGPRIYGTQPAWETVLVRRLISVSCLRLHSTQRAVPPGYLP